MHSIPFKEQNFISDGETTPDTQHMPVSVCINGNSGTDLYTISCWRVTPEDLEEINRTGILWLVNKANPAPPIAAMAFDPFKEFGFVPLPPKP